jgi:uncharacterized protein (TIGR02453 family)
MEAYFQPAALKFLRGLARHNERAWFEERRSVYESDVKAPMLALIDAINQAMLGSERTPGFAVEHVRPAPKAMMRIYRDIRFSNDKRPYKTHVAAWWSRRGMEKTSGGGYYLHVGPKDVLISAGVYMPEREQLLTIRRWMAEHHEEFRGLLKRVLKPRAGERAAMTLVGSEALTRMPKGFASDHPADELLRAKNWGVHVLLPGEAALEATLLREVVAGFKRAAPLVDALNDAIASGIARPSESLRRPLF